MRARVPEGGIEAVEAGAEQTGAVGRGNRPRRERAVEAQAAATGGPRARASRGKGVNRALDTERHQVYLAIPASAVLPALRRAQAAEWTTRDHSRLVDAVINSARAVVDAMEPATIDLDMLRPLVAFSAVSGVMTLQGGGTLLKEYLQALPQQEAAEKLLKDPVGVLREVVLKALVKSLTPMGP